MNRPTNFCIAVLLGSLFGAAVSPVLAQSNVDPAHKFAWGENIGWTNWQHDTPALGDGVFVHASFLSGYLWGENVGWINLGDGTPDADCDGLP